MAPDTLNVRAGPGIEYEIQAALRPNACILRSAGAPTTGWQPIHVIVAGTVELVVLEGWVSSNFVRPAGLTGTAEAAVVASNPASILSVGTALTDPLLTDPCEDVAAGRRSCALSDWFWQVAPHPCAQHPISHWKLSTLFSAEAAEGVDGSWTVQTSSGLVLDC